MRKTTRILLTIVAVSQIAAAGVQAAVYALDNGGISTALNASDGTEPRDNWFGNVFLVDPTAPVITRVDFGVFTTAGLPASVALYRVTDPGGNPALGATRVYTQSFNPLSGDGTNAFLQQINLTTPVTFNPGDRFLVSILIPNVIAAPPNDKYPFLLDTSGNATGTYWNRSNPGAFNLDDLSGALRVDQTLAGASWNPGPGHIIIRAVGIVPEPSAMALTGLGLAALAVYRRRAK